MVAHEIATIQTRYPEASANLLRALTALAGGQPTSYVNGTPVVGIYGVPDASRVLESAGNSVFFVYEGEIPTNSHAVLQIPIPPEFAAGASRREFRVALAFDPPTRRSRRDYIAGRMHYDFLQKAEPSEVHSAYAKQRSTAEVAADPTLSRFQLPPRVDMKPPYTQLNSSTLICRTYDRPSGGWDEDDRYYHLVVTHEHSPWSDTQKKANPVQTFALAIHMIDRGRPSLDLYALSQALLRARTRARISTP